MLLEICLTAVCFMIYVPVISNAIRQIQRGQVVLSFYKPPRRYTGASLLVYSGAQAAAAVLVLMGMLTVVSGSGANAFLVLFIASWLVGFGGLWLANQVGYDEVTQEEIMTAFAQSLGNFFSFGGTASDRQMQDDNETAPDVIVLDRDDYKTSKDDDDIPDIVILPPDDDKDR
jgi:hypothetical protein